jgi:hypothetical protein
MSNKSYTLPGFEPGIFCSGGGNDDHYAMPPGQKLSYKERYRNNVPLAEIMIITYTTPPG